MTEIPIKERDKLYPYVPVSLLPVLVVTGITLGILFFDFRGNFQTNPVIFYALPFLYLITFMTIETPATILRTIGLNLPTLRSKIIAIISLPVGGLLGWGLVQLATSQLMFFKIATYPWVLSTFENVGLTTLASLSTLSSAVLYFFVALFEEGTAIYIGKNIANWLGSKKANVIFASIFGLFLGRIVLVAHHWFSYDGLQNFSLYLSALSMFVAFTIVGILFGMLAQGFFVGKDLSNLKVIPILLPPMLAAHFLFDYLLSALIG